MNGAVISECGLYRYELSRFEKDADPSLPLIGYYGINPSTAGPEIDDHSTRKLMVFTRLYPARGYILGNPFGLRAADVKALRGAHNPVGPDNDHFLHQIIRDVDIHVPMWGNRTKVPKNLRFHFDDLADLLFASGKPVLTFGLTIAGDPMHPLMIGYNTVLQPWVRT